MMTGEREEKLKERIQDLLRLLNECQAERDTALGERDALREELEGYRRFKQNVDEALNSGDGSYRP